MNLIGMKLAYELEAQRVEYKKRQMDAEFELAKTKEILDSLSIYTKAINKTVQQFETKPMFVESLLKKLDIVDVEALEEKKGELEKELLLWDIDELEARYECRITAVTYPYKRLVIEELKDRHNWGDGLTLGMGSRFVEEELVLDSLWRDVWSGGNRKFLSGGTWSHVRFRMREPNYQRFQTEARKELIQKAGMQAFTKEDAFEQYRTNKAIECLGQITEEYYVQLFTDLLADLHKFSDLAERHYKSMQERAVSAQTQTEG